VTPVITKDSRRRPAPGRLPLDFRPVGPDRTPARRPGGACSDGDRLTLEERISSVWEGLVAAGAGECPVCRSRMEWIADHGRCSICGTRLY
jgi:hypothetical protein